MQTEIVDLQGSMVFDSRGNPTVAAAVTLACGTRGEAMVPSGASTGRFEALELRDGGQPFGGKGVERALTHLEGPIREALVGQDATQQRALDLTLIHLDGTPDKSRLGANAILAASLAAARAAAATTERSLFAYLGGVGATLLPVPMMNVINGGVHASNNLDLQEFMLVPHGLGSYRAALAAGVETYHALKSELTRRGLATTIGDEGGFAPDLARHEEALELMVTAIERAGLRPGTDISLALDPAASEFYHEGRYVLAGEGLELDRDGMIAYYAKLVDAFPIVSIEDPMAEEDWAGWAAFTAELGSRIQVVGDDIFVTNSSRLARGLSERSANSILIKLNQVGTLTETLETMELARSHGWTTVVSHRSGETEDAFIADLAVATNSGQIKAGAPARSDRVAKYNRLLAIEAELGEAARFIDWTRARGQ
jgi:enolase